MKPNPLLGKVRNMHRGIGRNRPHMGHAIDSYIWCFGFLLFPMGNQVRVGSCLVAKMDRIIFIGRGKLERSGASF